MNSSHLSMNSRFAPQNSPSSGQVSSLKSCSSPSQHGRRLASCSTLWRSCTWKSLAACLRPPALSHCSISTYPVLEVKTCLDRDSNTDSFFFWLQMSALPSRPVSFCIPCRCMSYSSSRLTPPAVAFTSRRMRHMVFGKQVRRISEVGTCKMVAL